MTKKEAIKRIKEVRFTIQPYQYINEALDMAIKALSQEPCEDAVSRQAVLERSYDRYDYTTDKPIEVVNVDEIKELPSVLPKRKKGEWIDYQDEGYVECPICGSATNCDDNKEDLHYCFSCGAEMR